MTESPDMTSGWAIDKLQMECPKAVLEPFTDDRSAARMTSKYPVPGNIGWPKTTCSDKKAFFTSKANVEQMGFEDTL
tara:strand:+ start:126 stop:356 length:231 start_codon:yes stop_codon:yes gene_type:complete